MYRVVYRILVLFLHFVSCIQQSVFVIACMMNTLNMRVIFFLFTLLAMLAVQVRYICLYRLDNPL